MHQDFSELVKYLDEKFINIDRRFDEMKKDFVDLQTSVDAYTKRADAFFQDPISYEVTNGARMVIKY